MEEEKEKNQTSTYHPSFLRSYYHVKESANHRRHRDINADFENSRNRNH
jgi:hypothetical protein